MVWLAFCHTFEVCKHHQRVGSSLPHPIRTVHLVTASVFRIWQHAVDQNAVAVLTYMVLFSMHVGYSAHTCAWTPASVETCIVILDLVLDEVPREGVWIAKQQPCLVNQQNLAKVNEKAHQGPFNNIMLKWCEQQYWRKICKQLDQGQGRPINFSLSH